MSENTTEDKTEDNDWEQYTSVTEKRLSEGPIIQRIGTFYPRRRKGYSDSRTEQRIQKRTARLIYDNRITIARRIVQSPYVKKDEVLNDALVQAKIAPNSVDGWKDYIILIADREGGWDIFLKKLSKDIKDVDYHQKQIVTGWIIALVASLVSFLSPLVFSPILGDTWAATLVYALLLGIGIAVVVFTGVLRSRRSRPIIKELVGTAVRDPDSFVTAEKVQTMV